MRLIDAETLIACISPEEIVSKMVISLAPTIDAELVKHGHWIVCNDLTANNMYLDENEYYKCSECGKTKGRKSNYCPNCGAKMKDENNETY